MGPGHQGLQVLKTLLFCSVIGAYSTHAHTRTYTRGQCKRTLRLSMVDLGFVA